MLWLFQNLMCRQKDIIDLRSGLIIKTLDDFVRTKHYVTAAITHNERFLLIGEENVRRAAGLAHPFDFSFAITQKRVAQLASLRKQTFKMNPVRFDFLDASVLTFRSEA